MQADETDQRGSNPRERSAFSRATIRSSWAEAREVHPFHALVRVIHTERKLQVFIPLAPGSRGEDYDLEGQTLIAPAPADGFTDEERAQILREYDAGPYIPRR